MSDAARLAAYAAGTDQPLTGFWTVDELASP